MFLKSMTLCRNLSFNSCLNLPKHCLERNWGKFPHNTILYYAFSSWIEKERKKQYIAIGKTDLFNNSMRLCVNFTQNFHVGWLLILVIWWNICNEFKLTARLYILINGEIKLEQYMYQNVVFHLCYAVQIESNKHHKLWYFKQIMII